MLKGGVDVVGSSPQEFAAAIKTEIERKAKLIKDLGLRTP
jgi:flavin-binding protein dodecin